MVAVRSVARQAEARRPACPSQSLAPDDLLHWHRTMLLARVISERIWLLNRLGKVHLAVTCQGHEAAQIGSAAALRAGVDICVPYYRDLAVMLMLGMTPRTIMLNAFARRDDPNSGGRQMPAHWSWPERKVLTTSSPVATQIPHAVGMALAAKLRGQDSCAIVYFGDGATSQGDFHEAVNFAAIHQLPVVFFCENNGLAISVPYPLQSATPTIAEKAAAYGIPGVRVEGHNVLAVYDATFQALERARRGEGPTLVDAVVPRLTPHTSNDDESRYRPAEEREQARIHDPLAWFSRYLKDKGYLNDVQEQSELQDVKDEVEEATEHAEESPDPHPAQLFTHLFAGNGRTP
ncbi:MAG: thiamine pyrophosphate-dependent dehydrogenase E1 component subunit alpha [Chloroflexi bacterium]|nr:thiamine pyrophosphate-dependent dehydrogenase E1 component subunit alpha [Chloroflexota bacterium]